MNPAIRQLIEKARADLQPIDPVPWMNITTWAAGVRAAIKAGASEHLIDFEKVVQSPGGSLINSNGATSEWERPQERQRRAASIEESNAKTVRRYHAGKAAIIAFLDSLLSLPSELFADPRKAAADAYPSSSVHYSTHISHSNIGALASGQGSAAHGTVNTTITQAEHKESIKRAQAALLNDQDEIESTIYDVLWQFLRLAREIQVEQKNMAEIQTMMKDALDEVWAKQMAEGLRSQALSKTLAVVAALSKIPAMVKVVEALTGG